MNTSEIVYLKALPMVRRLEYLEVFLRGVRDKLDRNEINVALGERKKAFEIEKDLALGRGKPHRKDITQAKRLLKYCIRLTKELEFVHKVDSSYELDDIGKTYLESDFPTRRRIFSDAFSNVYPHLRIIVMALLHLDGTEAVLPLGNKPKFEPEAEKFGFSIGQMYFDTVRDIGTSLGFMNWYVSGIGLERRQHLYLASQIVKNEPESYIVRIRNRDQWLYAVPFEVQRKSFRDSLWEYYLFLAEGIPGAPVFYSSVREHVCAALKLRDDQFDNEVMRMVNSDEILQVIWSEGVLQYRKDTASMLKSLPPKNEWGRYVVYLKIVKR